MDEIEDTANDIMAEVEDTANDILMGTLVAAAVVGLISVALIVVSAVYTAKLRGTGDRYIAAICLTVFSIFFPLLGIVPPILHATK